MELLIKKHVVEIDMFVTKIADIKSDLAVSVTLGDIDEVVLKLLI